MTSHYDDLLPFGSFLFAHGWACVYVLSCHSVEDRYIKLIAVCTIIAKDQTVRYIASGAVIQTNVRNVLTVLNKRSYLLVCWWALDAKWATKIKLKQNLPLAVSASWSNGHTNFARFNHQWRHLSVFNVMNRRVALSRQIALLIRWRRLADLASDQDVTVHCKGK